MSSTMSDEEFERVVAGDIDIEKLYVRLQEMERQAVSLLQRSMRLEADIRKVEFPNEGSLTEFDLVNRELRYLKASVAFIAFACGPGLDNGCKKIIDKIRKIY